MCGLRVSTSGWCQIQRPRPTKDAGHAHFDRPSPRARPAHRLCSTLGQVGRVELLRAVRRGAISLIECPRSGIPPRRALEDQRRPVLVLLGDDDYAATGPAGWAAMPRLLRWARGALVHGTGTDVPTYQAAVAGTLATGRFVLVETSAAVCAGLGYGVRPAHHPRAGAASAQRTAPGRFSAGVGAVSAATDRLAPRALLLRTMISIEVTPSELSMLIELLETRATIAANHSEQVDFADFLFRRIAELRDAFR